MNQPAQKQSFLQLLRSVNKFVIPKIQRDYAQGRSDVNGAVFYSEIRDNFLKSLSNALENGTELVLDYIYGSDDDAKHFYPIDGQQRMTTLFLLHWYIAAKEGKLDENTIKELNKFSYETRDTTIEFCASLLKLNPNDIDIAHTKSLSDAIRNSNIYHCAYDMDPTVASMLVMLNKMHEEFCDKPNLWNNLDKITFWRLTLENFGLTDDLFVKMNARGKRLSKFDTFKSDLESDLEKREKRENTNDALSAAIQRWEVNIDNDYLNHFWSHFHNSAKGKNGSVAERNIFRLIMFYTKCLNAKIGYDESWEINDKEMSYRAEKEAIANNTSLLDDICTIMERFPRWIKSDTDGLLKQLLITDDLGARIIPYYDKVKLFAVLYWWAKIDDNRNEKNFAEFYRVLCNYVNSLRQYNIKPGQFGSVIDASNLKTHIAFVKKLIDVFASKTVDFVAFIKSTSHTELGIDKSNFKEIEYEKEKYLSADLDKIKQLEKIPALGRLTQNFFFDGKLYLEADELNTILRDQELTKKYLRIVLSYGDTKYGRFNDLLFEGTTKQTNYKIKVLYESGDDRVTGYFHRCYLINSNDRINFGEKFLTSPQAGNSSILKDLSDAIRTFAKEFNAKRQGTAKSVKEILDEILAERLQANEHSFSDKSSILGYVVKYPNSFFYYPAFTALMVCRKKDNDKGYYEDNVYHIQCAAWFDLNDKKNKHFNPFYLALCHKLTETKSKVTIEEDDLRFSDANIYDHPCLLSNGWQVEIMLDGDWKITFNGNLPKNASTISGLTDDEYTLKNKGVDCVEALAEFIQNNPV